MEFYSAIKKEIMSFTGKGMQLRFMWSKIGKRSIAYFLVRGSWNKKHKRRTACRGTVEGQGDWGRVRKGSWVWIRHSDSGMDGDVRENPMMCTINAH